MNFIDKLLDTATKLSSLEPAAIFALIAMAEGYYIWKGQQSSEKWRQTRENGIAAENAVATNLGQVNQTLVELKMLLLKYLIKE